MLYRDYVRKLSDDGKLGSMFKPVVTNTNRKPAFERLAAIKNGEVDRVIHPGALKLFKFNGSNERDGLFSKGDT